MRRAMPPITEGVDDLKQRLQREQDRRKKPRLHMLYLLVTGQAHTRQHLATLLGISRNTVGHWLGIYEAGGLPALLDVYVPLGKRSSLAPEVLASIAHALQQPDGFASYEALRQWIEQTHQVQVKYKTLYTLVRTRFKAKLQRAAPQSPKKTLMQLPPFKQHMLIACKLPRPIASTAL